MASHADILDQPEPLGKWLAASVAVHLSVAGVVLAMGIAWSGSHQTLGSPNGGGFGAVAVTPVPYLPLPSRSGPENPVANETESKVPEPPPKNKAQAKFQEPPPDAIPINSRNAARKAAQAASAMNKFRAKQHDLPNQLYAQGGQALSSQMYQIPGGGGVGIGSNSPLGEQFGWYVNVLREQVGRNWRTTGFRQGPRVVLAFTIRRDGTVPPESIRFQQRSGNPALDYSAQRAVLDAAPFPPLPPGLNRNEVNIEFWFELGR